MRRGAIALTVLAFLAAACGGEDESAALEAELRLELSSPGGLAGGPIPIKATLTNGTTDTVTVARPFFAGNIVAFAVEDAAGDPVPFDGPFAELRPLDDDRIATLAPGESVSHDFDLAAHFMLEAGSYTVTAEYFFQPPGEGGRALAVAPGAGPLASAITIEVSP